MDNKITMSGLAAMIALASGQPGELCEDFLKELFRIIGDELEKGESVRIKGLGTFKVAEVEARKSVDVTTGEDIEIAPHRKVVFVASKELAALVNAPFEAFEAVEVSDALPTDELLDVAEGLDSESFSDVTDESDAESFADIVEVADEEVGAEENEVAAVEDKTEKEIAVESQSDEDNSDEDNSKELKIVETVGPVIINSGILDIRDEEGENQVEPSSSEEAQVANEADDMVEEERARVISFSSSPTAGQARRRNNPEDGDNKRAANKEPIKTIHFETADEDEDEKVEPHRSRFGSGFLTGFLSAIALIAVVLLIGFKFNMMPDKVGNMLTKNTVVDAGANEGEPDATAVLPDSAYVDTSVGGQEVSGVSATSSANAQAGQSSSEDAVPTQASDEPVYDVVSTTRYLTTMAKEHYGNFNLWPIIYEENQSFLGHPDRIKPGTQVVIPPLSKYKVDPNNPDDVKRIKQRGVAIYAKYK